MPEEIDDQKTLVREVSFVVGGDGRTIEARIVPYNKVARVADPPDYEEYQERWLPGAFDRQTRAADRIKVWLNFEHEPGLRGIVGHGTELVEREDGLYGVFRVHPGADGDKALHMIAEGLTTGLSLEATPIRTRVNAGIVERVKARLQKVSLTWKPAYTDAQIIAVREEHDEVVVDEPEPSEPDPDPQPEPDPESKVQRDDLTAALQAVGYERVVVRAKTDSPWDGSPARFTDEEYQRSAVVCREGDDPPKSRCSLPVLEPNGDLNTNALVAAASRIHQTSLPMDEKARAARKLVRLYRQAQMEPPPRLLSLASR
jgi:HK97 family phage prohead protease